MHPSADLSVTAWRKSSKSTAQGNECVEIADMSGFIAIRDSKHSTGLRVTMRRSSFTLLAQQIRRGQYDLEHHGD
ncbi:DUF397 domain-containing protein [Actinomadura sp. 21ATH]|uniref:DUF397 domain-containing protein n=1 Tax=Actinomadura sp. 21ATH TaxID=1735444 RepID=UPI0035C103F4